jgi:hypothetical protein
VYRRDTVAFTGHGSQQLVSIVEPDASAWRALEQLAGGHAAAVRGGDEIRVSSSPGGRGGLAHSHSGGQRQRQPS